MYSLVLAVIFVVVVSAVPPRDNTGETGENIQNEIAIIRQSMRIVSEQWEKWNTHFIISLEPRISSAAATLTSIDSNIHNLQERAHVWDTFQLHVSAWNEQLASLDRKMDIVSKSQEKLQESYEMKMASILTGLENKLEILTKKITTVEEDLGDLKVVVQKKHLPSRDNSLFEEFAARGVLSSIKSLERKIDLIALTNQNVFYNNKSSDDKTKLSIKCNTPKAFEELLNDISSKVDVVFDTVTEKRILENDYENEDYIDNNETTTPPTSWTASLRVAKRGAYLSPRRTCDDVIRKLDNISSKNSLMTQNIENITRNCVSIDYDLIYSRIKFYSDESVKFINSMMNSLFLEQRAHFASMIKKLSINDCNTREATVTNPLHTSTATPLEEEPIIVTTEIYSTDEEFSTTLTHKTTDESTTLVYNTTVELNKTKKEMIDKNIQSCDDLEYNANSGVYDFDVVQHNEKGFFGNKRYCEIREDGLWTVIQRRDNFPIQHIFNTTWNNYTIGFGDVTTDFWLGNDNMYVLTKVEPLILRIELEDFEGNMAWAEYEEFQILSATENFQLLVKGYSGNASDSFSSHNGSYFSTFDRKHDAAPDCCPCAESYGGGWWFNSCFESNLNGVYYSNPYANGNFRGIIWEHWLGNYSLKKTLMMVKQRGLVYSSSNKPNIIPDYEDP